MLIQKHQDQWEDDFKQVKNILVEGIPSNDLRIEHIGSTSVKGLAAKPIIDINIVYENLPSFDVIKGGLEELGYYHNGDQGIQGRETFRRFHNAVKHRTLDKIIHHLYVCHLDSEEIKRHLAFRDYLRANERERKEYEKLKYKIAEIADQDQKAYAKLKETMAREFIESFLYKSQEK